MMTLHVQRDKNTVFRGKLSLNIYIAITFTMLSPFYIPVNAEGAPCPEWLSYFNSNQLPLIDISSNSTGANVYVGGSTCVPVRD